MKEFLSHGGHAFVVRNVEEDHQAYTDLLTLGYRTIPLTLIGGRAIPGFDERALRDALQSGGES